MPKRVSGTPATSSALARFSPRKTARRNAKTETIAALPGTAHFHTTNPARPRNKCRILRKVHLRDRRRGLRRLPPGLTHARPGDLRPGRPHGRKPGPRRPDDGAFKTCRLEEEWHLRPAARRPVRLLNGAASPWWARASPSPAATPRPGRPGGEHPGRCRWVCRQPSAAQDLTRGLLAARAGARRSSSPHPNT